MNRLCQRAFHRLLVGSLLAASNPVTAAPTRLTRGQTYRHTGRRVGKATLVAGITAIILIAMMGMNAGSTHAAAGSAVITLDNVRLTIQAPRLPSTTFTISPAGSQTVGATSTSLRPFRSLSIVTVPYGTMPNELNLPLATRGSANVYAAITHTALAKEKASFAGAPAANLFGKAVTGEASRLNRDIPGESGFPLVDSVQWIVEVGNRVWIVTALEQVGSDQRLGDHAKRFASGLVITSDNPGAATGIGHFSANTSTQTPSTSAGATFSRLYGSLSAPFWWAPGSTCNNNGTLLTTGQGKLGGLQICTRPDGTLEGGRVTAIVDNGWIYEWQCTELSERYMDVAWGVSPYLSADANSIASTFPFSTYPNIEKISNNGVAGLVPQPGDVIQMSTDGSNPAPGHTGLVESTSINSSGNGSLVFDSENGSLAGRYNLNVSGWVVGGDGVNYTTAWLHNPNDTQSDDYVYSVGQNGHLYDYHWSGSAGWSITDLGAPGNALTGSPSGQTEIQDGSVVQDLYVNGTEGNLHEYWYQNGAWHNGTLYPPSGVSFIGSPSAFSYTLPAQTAENHSVFDIGSNGHLYNYSWHEGVSGWALTDLSATFGAYVSTSWSPSAQAFLQSGSEVQDVYVASSNYTLGEFWWNGSWHFSSPGGAVPLPSGVSVWSTPSAMTFSYPNSPSTTRHSVFFTGSNGHLYDYQWAQGSSWSWNDITNAVGSVSAQYDPSANFLVQSGSGVQDVFVAGTDGDIHEYYFSQSNNAWRTGDISVAASATGYSIIGGPSSFSNFLTFAPMTARHSVFVITSDGHLREFVWAQNTTPWQLVDHGAPSNTTLSWSPNAHSF